MYASPILVKENLGVKKKKKKSLNLFDHEKVKENSSILKKVKLVYQAKEINESAITNIL